MVAVSAFNLIDIDSIVSNLMVSDTARSTRLTAQKTERNDEITAFQTLNTSLLAIATKAEAISESTSWVPATVASSDSSTATAYASGGAVAGDSPYPFTVTTIVGGGSDTATITYTKNGVLQTKTSASNTFTGLADFPGLTITVAQTGGPVTLTPATTASTTASVMTSAAEGLVDALNTTLALITTQTASNAVFSNEFTPREISQKLLNTAFDEYTLASLSDAGIQLTRTGTFTFTEGTLTTALAGASSEEVIGQVGAFAARVDTLVTQLTSVTGSISREISARQDQVNFLTGQITEATEDIARRKESLTIYYSELNAQIQAMQNQQTYLKTQLDVFVKSIYSNN